MGYPWRGPLGNLDPAAIDQISAVACEKLVQHPQNSTHQRVGFMYGPARTPCDARPGLRENQSFNTNTMSLAVSVPLVAS